MTILKDVTFRFKSQSVEWITTGLRTITHKHQDLQQISIHLPPLIIPTRFGANTRQTIGEAIYGQWFDLDCLLVQFWESRSIRPRVICATRMREEWEVRDFLGCLLPETTKRGIIDLVCCAPERV